MRDHLVGAVALGVSWVAKKHTRERAWRELMRGGGGGARVAAAAEDTKIVVGGRHTKEKLVRRIVPTHTAGADVDEESRHGEGIRPEPWGHVGMKQKGAHAVVESTKNAFGATVLLRSVWTRETKNGTVGGEEGADGDVVELFAVIGLEGMYGSAELGGDVCEKGGEGGGDVGFTA